MQTFEQIQQQILDLQKQADTMRKQAMTAAIKEVKRLVNLYSLGYADIGMTVGGSPAKKGAAAAKNKAAKSTKPAKAAKKASSDKRAAVAPPHDDQPRPGQGHARFVHPRRQFKQLQSTHFCISHLSQVRRVVCSLTAMIQVSEAATEGRMGAWAENMDRLLPPRISVSNSRKKVGE